MKELTAPRRYGLIIGAMKCGTTTLFDLLGEHPQVCASKVKEPDFFTPEGGVADAGKYQSLWSWNPAQHHIAIEASVSYAKLPYFPGVATRIRDAQLGDVRFIYMMRHPLSRIESQARHALYGGWGKSLDERIDPDLIDYSRYAMQLDEYRRLFGRDRLLPLFLDELEQNPQATLRKICVFLDINDAFVFADPGKRSNTGDLFTAWPVISSVSKSAFGKALLSRGIPSPIKSYIRSSMARFRPTKPESTKLVGRWRLNPQERQLLWAELGSDMQRLQSDYGLTLPPAWRTEQI